MSNVTVFADDIDQNSMNQIDSISNLDFMKSEKIVIMPDVHSGKGCVIGSTLTYSDHIIPNIVGVDIGCGIMGYIIKNMDLDFEKINIFIQNQIPHGPKRHNSISSLSEVFRDKLKKIICPKIDFDHELKGLGTLGGGNHFIEIGINSKNEIGLFVHSGSRSLGLNIATFYQDIAISRNPSKDIPLTDNEKENLIKRKGSQYIPPEFKNEKLTYDEKQLLPLCGDDMFAYLNDMQICLEYAELNRKLILDSIINELNIDESMIIDKIDTIHNYVDIKNKIIRKGAISSQKDEIILIPMNMRDGIFYSRGKGNPDWNYSAPHGAGRLFSRNKAKSELSIDEFKETMKDIWSTSVKESTLDESPMAYRPMDSIRNQINDTCEIVDIFKSIYNFKSN